MLACASFACESLLPCGAPRVGAMEKHEISQCFNMRLRDDNQYTGAIQYINC